MDAPVPPAGANFIRSCALALPLSEEREHMGVASFRVKGKIFAQLCELESLVLVKLTLTRQAELIGRKAERFWRPAHWGTFGWTYVRIAGSKHGDLRLLVEGSWRRIAPQSLS